MEDVVTKDFARVGFTSFSFSPFSPPSPPPPPTTISWSVTILGCRRKANKALISRNAMTGNPSFHTPFVNDDDDDAIPVMLSWFSFMLGNFICFNAMMVFLSLDNGDDDDDDDDDRDDDDEGWIKQRAFHTIPYDPSLMRAIFSYVSYTDRHPTGE